MNLKISEKFVHCTDGSRRYRYYTQIARTERIDAKEFLATSARGSHLQRHELLQALESLHAALSRLIGEGHIVEVPFIGTFRLTACARVADRRSDAGAAALKKVKVTYHPAALMLPENITSSTTHII